MSIVEATHAKNPAQLLKAYKQARKLARPATLNFRLWLMGGIHRKINSHGHAPKF